MTESHDCVAVAPKPSQSQLGARLQHEADTCLPGVSHALQGNRYNKDEPGTPFCHGGAGYVLSRAMLRELGPFLAQCMEEEPFVTSGWEDVKLGGCIYRHLGQTCLTLNGWDVSSPSAPFPSCQVVSARGFRWCTLRPMPTQ